MSLFLCKDLPVIAFDMDGTLLTHQGAIHRRDIEFLTMSDPPAIFVPTTGRSLFAMRRILQTFGICGEEAIPFPMILQNGSLILNPGEERLRFTPFDLKIQEGVLKLFQSRPEVSFLLFSDDRLRLLNPTPFGLEETRRYMYEPEIYDENAPADACTKILCLGENHEAVVSIRELVKDFDLEVALSKPTILEFNPRGVNKGAGLEFLLEYNAWEKNRVFCAGDGDNDVEMFRRFDTTFTPDTSPDYIKLLATHVIDTRKDGLFTTMLNIILNEKK
jgi:Cof subfamily protein (haloacid dehalogenase superfamily)